jgi:hypothetical protein
VFGPGDAVDGEAVGAGLVQGADQVEPYAPAFAHVPDRGGGLRFVEAVLAVAWVELAERFAAVVDSLFPWSSCSASPASSSGGSGRGKRSLPLRNSRSPSCMSATISSVLRPGWVTVTRDPYHTC